MSFELRDFFVNTPLYEQVKLEDVSDIYRFNNKNTTFDGFNPIKNLETTFRVENLYPVNTSLDFFYDNGGIATVSISCLRTKCLFFFYLLWNPEIKGLTKVGQSPSVADFHTYQVKKYNKLLPAGMLREFTKAIGLAAHGVGIGSFVYLRRIFEYLIQEAYTKAGDTIAQDVFEKARMNEKVELLKDHLPNFLVEQRNLYSILSLGIHELDEKICLEHFDTVRLGIEMILDEKLIEFEREKKKDEAKKRIAALSSSIKNNVTL